MSQRYYGKYRGKVENNIDPMQLGRVQVSVPAVLGEGRLSWAMPCSPFAGSGVGLLLTPPRGANVWVEFEGGDLDHPILAGCFWGTAELASLSAPLPQIKVLKVDGITLTLSELPGVGGLTLEVGPPAVAIPVKLVCNATGVELTHGKSSIKLTPVSVSINNGALEVI
jgi:hypothetical protein